MQDRLRPVRGFLGLEFDRWGSGRNAEEVAPVIHLCEDVFGLKMANAFRECACDFERGGNKRLLGTVRGWHRLAGEFGFGVGERVVGGERLGFVRERRKPASHDDGIPFVATNEEGDGALSASACSPDFEVIVVQSVVFGEVVASCFIEVFADEGSGWVVKEDLKDDIFLVFFAGRGLFATSSLFGVRRFGIRFAECRIAFLGSVVWGGAPGGGGAGCVTR